MGTSSTGQSDPEGIDPLVLRKTSKQIYYLFVSFSLRQSPDGGILGFIFLSSTTNLYRNDVNINIENDRVSRQETTHSLKFMMDKLIFRLPWWLSGKESTCQCRSD